MALFPFHSTKFMNFTLRSLFYAFVSQFVVLSFFAYIYIFFCFYYIFDVLFVPFVVFVLCESEKWHLIVTYLDRNEADRLQSGAYVQITSLSH